MKRQEAQETAKAILEDHHLEGDVQAAELETC
jgi:hypothetical protein